jgi:hypothetical protein
MTTDSDYIDAITAIRAGDLAKLQRLLTDNPGFASSRLGGIAKGRTPLQQNHHCLWPSQQGSEGQGTGHSLSRNDSVGRQRQSGQLIPPIRLGGIIC